MSTRKKRKVKMIDAKESNHKGTHPSETELQNWTLLPDALAAEESERIKSHVESCVTCKVYCELVRAAEKDAEAYLQTETGRNRGQNLLDRIVSSDCHCRVPAACVTVNDSSANRPAKSVVVAGDNSTEEASVVEPDIICDATQPRLPMYDRRKKQARLEKLAIGECVSNILAQGGYSGEAVGFDGGTTNETIAEVLSRDAKTNGRERRVLITNHRLIPQLVSEQSDRIQVLGVGGLYRPDRETFVGDQAIENIKRLQYAVSVLGINGFNPPWLLTTSGVEDGIKKAFIRSSRDIILAFDSSKWGFISGSRLATLSNLFGPEYLMDPDGRTVYLVTTYPVMHPAADGTEYAKVLRYRERFLAGVKRLTTNGWNEYDSLVRGIIVRFPDAETLDPTFEPAEAHQLDHLPLDYFENLERDRVENCNNAAQSVLVVSIELICDFVNTRRQVGRQHHPQNIESSSQEVAAETNID